MTTDSAKHVDRKSELDDLLPLVQARDLESVQHQFEEPVSDDSRAPGGTLDSSDIANAVIAAMNLCDPIAAHDCGKDKRHLRVGETPEAQSLAHAILVCAVNVAQEPKGSVKGS